MNPGHPFTRKGEHDVAVLELGCHCDQNRVSHPKECHPRDPEDMDVDFKRLTRSECRMFLILTMFSIYPIKAVKSTPGSTKPFSDFSKRELVAEFTRPEIICMYPNFIPQLSRDQAPKCQEQVIKLVSTWNRQCLSCRNLRRRRYSPRYDYLRAMLHQHSQFFLTLADNNAGRNSKLGQEEI